MYKKRADQMNGILSATRSPSASQSNVEQRGHAQEIRNGRLLTHNIIASTIARSSAKIVVRNRRNRADRRQPGEGSRGGGDDVGGVASPPTVCTLVERTLEKKTTRPPRTPSDRSTLAARPPNIGISLPPFAHRRRRRRRRPRAFSTTDAYDLPRSNGRSSKSTRKQTTSSSLLSTADLYTQPRFA